MYIDWRHGCTASDFHDLARTNICIDLIRELDYLNFVLCHDCMSESVHTAYNNVKAETMETADALHSN